MSAEHDEDDSDDDSLSGFLEVWRNEDAAAGLLLPDELELYYMGMLGGKDALSPDEQTRFAFVVHKLDQHKADRDETAHTELAKQVGELFQAADTEGIPANLEQIGPRTKTVIDGLRKIMRTKYE